MAYSTNPFSVAAFGESYEQADIAVTLTGVVGTGVVDTGLDVSSRTTVNVTGLQGDGAIGAPTLEADAITGVISGVAATAAANTVVTISEAVVIPAGLDANSSTNSVDVTTEVNYTVTGVSSTSELGTLDAQAQAVVSTASVTATGAVDDVTIIAKAVVIPDGVEAAIITDDPLVTGDEIVINAEAVVVPNSNDGVSSIGVSTIAANANVAPTGVEAQAITDDPLIVGDEVEIDADANVILLGVSGSGALEDVDTLAPAVVIPASVVASVAVGTTTITTVQFDYEAIKNSYSRLRTDYVREADMGSRTVYVEAQTSSYRTAYARAA